jgi:hypothetical protein
VAHALEEAAKERRKETASLFAAEIAASGDPVAVERAVALISSGRGWDVLRGEMGLGTKAAREQLAFMLRSALRR